MNPIYSIAVAQTIPVRGDVEANVDCHLRLVQTAAARDAQIIVFPELSLTGYEMGLARSLTFVENDSRLSSLIESARSHSMIVIVGAPVVIADGLYIGAVIISPDRTIKLYTKHRLGAFPASASCDGIVPRAEATVFQPGKLNPLVRFGGVTAAVAICADTGHPSHAEDAARRGANVYLASMFVIPSEFDRETANLESYAALNSMAVAFANFGGPSGGLNSAGRSTIWSPKGELLVQLDAKGIGVAVAHVDQKGWRANAEMVHV